MVTIMVAKMLEEELMMERLTVPEPVINVNITERQLDIVCVPKKYTIINCSF